MNQLYHFIHRLLCLEIMFFCLTDIFAVEIHDHTYSDIGICTHSGCGKYQPPAEIEGYRMIANLGNLYWVASQFNTVPSITSINAKLTQDIIVNENVLKRDGTLNECDFRVWESIGSSSKPYTGTFDGQGHTISGLYLNDNTLSSLGLFGYVRGATIKNVNLVDSYFYAKNYIGGIVGEINDNNTNSTMTTISNCHNYSTIVGERFVGGICGYQNDASSTVNIDKRSVIKMCTNNGSVKGNDFVGGIIGRAHNIELLACGNCSSVECNTSNCLNVGGIMGHSAADLSGRTTINRCFNNYNSTACGGIAGYASINTAIYNSCYADGTNIELSQSNNATIDDTNKSYTIAEYKTGAAAYKMNYGSAEVYWYQTIGKDNFPVLTSGHGRVYRVQTKCCYNSTTETEGYSNENNLTILNNFEHIIAKKPTFSEVGNFEYYKCSCGKIYSSKPSAATNELTLVATVIPKLGDVNGDRKIDKDDVTACMKFVRCDDDTEGLYRESADCDDNGKVTVTDVAKIIDVANRNKGQ